MTYIRIHCPVCHRDITGNAVEADDVLDMAGDWDCEYCKTSFNISKITGKSAP